MENVIYGINGPVVTVKGSKTFKMLEMVYVGEEGLIGEVIGINGDMTIIQVYEITTGLRPGEPVISTGKPLSLKLAPGIIGNIFDGIERPLQFIKEKSGDYISRGVNIDFLDMNKKYPTKITVKNLDSLKPGMIIANVQETELVTTKITVPHGVEGLAIECAADGEYTISDTLIKVKDKRGVITELNMIQEWPVRMPRPYKNRIPINKPLITGQRIIDSLFPIGKGGTASIPGGFGTGKTMTQHQLAKWSDADIIVYIGCGERGNEMTEVLEDFPKLIDPKTNKSLMDRTVLIANTSNMPVAAREASIYTGVTLAEYYRDMGYHVAIMADSTSRWAEALREISGRLEEMPAEEGYPAYLPSRLSEFYERAGYVETLSQKEGSVTIIGAVSPQGGDFSEPVTQNTRRFVRAFWGLDRSLAYSRHYPAIHWLTSYSEYSHDLESYFNENVNKKFTEVRGEIMNILQQESKLMEIVKLIGADILPDEQKLVLEVARVVRLGFLQQNAFHKTDTFVPLDKQFYMMEIILHLYECCKELIKLSIPISLIKDEELFEDIVKMKYTISNDEIYKFEELKNKFDTVTNRIKQSYEGV